MLKLPYWILTTLLEQMPALEAMETQSAATVVSVPYLKERDRRSFFRQLASRTKRLAPEPEPMPIVEQDPIKAAEWFRSQGAIVVTKEADG